MGQRLDLTDVTLCAADSAFVDWTVRTFVRCQAHCDFAETILFSDASVDGPFRTIAIPHINGLADYSRFCLLEMGKHIKTKFALLVQWDSFVVDPDAWSRDFRRFDYIGAAWHGHFPGRPEVGNGGFSLRSQKLLHALVDLRPEASYFYEDQVISHLYRDVLEQRFGVRFATVEVADRFSYEFHQPTAPTFGFHGLQHLWKHLDDLEMQELAAAIDFKKMSAEKVLRLAANALLGGRTTVAAAVYARLRREYPAPRVAVALRGWLSNESEAAATLDRLERLLLTGT